MTAPPPTLQAADGGPIDLQAVLAVLATHFTVEPGPRPLVHRAQLDTFDRRLRSAGLSLEHHTGESESVLVLGRADAKALRTAVTGLTWPAFTADLPKGPVRDAVGRAIGIRALMVLSTQQRRVCRVDVCNKDAKVVVRLELDEPVAPGATAARLTVLALRGYDDQSRRAGHLLADLGLRPVAESPPDDAVPAVVGIDRAATATTLMVVELGDFLTDMRKNLPGLLDDIDTEFLHDFRVAVRRTRATLKLGRSVLPPVMRSRWEPAFKWLGDLTTPVRDLDVYLLGLPAMAGWLQAADPSDLEPFAAHLRRKRELARGALVRGLRSARFGRLLTQWQQALADLADAQDGLGRLSAVALAEPRISKAFRRVARGGAAISAESPADDLHSLRKRCKELRYALEVFAPVIDTAVRKKAVGDLKALQDVLGRFQDAEVQRQALREYAEEMMAEGTSAGAVLAMGELTGHLDGEQNRARREFDDAFDRFVRPASTRRMHQIGGGR